MVRDNPTRRRALRVAATVLLSASAWGAAHAEMYACVIGGRTITGDQPPFECRNVQIRILHADGSSGGTIEPPETPDQKKHREEEAQAKQKQEEEARQQHRHDRALLETYASEEEIVATRNRALNSRLSVADRAQLQLEEYKKERVKLDSEAEFYATHQMPPHLKRAIEVNDEDQRKQQKIVTDMKAEMTRIGDGFEAERRRFHELMLAGATARPPTPTSAAPGGEIVGRR